MILRIDPDPAAPGHHRFVSAVGEHLLVVPHTRIYDLSRSLADAFDNDPVAADRLARELGATAAGEDALDQVAKPSPQSLSLNVSSACNLSCGYCYASQGGFGGAQALAMTPEVAFHAVDRLLAGADPARPITIGFLGGEPLVNRSLVHAVVAHADGQAAGRDIRYSITTNGTLLSEADIALFRNRGFAVTISLDGGAATQDRQRPKANGGGSFALLAGRIAPLLAQPGLAKIAARLTVRAGEADLQARLDAVWSLGFAEAGVSPLRVAADDSDLKGVDWPPYLSALIAVSQREIERARRGLPIRLTNFAIALKQLAGGASSPYSCGAGGGYFSVSADGDWYACHRAIGQEAFHIGTSDALDETKRGTFLAMRHVHAKADCRSCWARYLCSGGCHQEAAARTEASCDFIRGWLDFCLAAYCEMSGPPQPVQTEEARHGRR